MASQNPKSKLPRKQLDSRTVKDAIRTHVVHAVRDNPSSLFVFGPMRWVDVSVSILLLSLLVVSHKLYDKWSWCSMIVDWGKRCCTSFTCSFSRYNLRNGKAMNWLNVVDLQSKAQKKELKRTPLSDPNCNANFALLTLSSPFHCSVSFWLHDVPKLSILVGQHCTLVMAKF